MSESFREPSKEPTLSEADLEKVAAGLNKNTGTGTGTGTATGVREAPSLRIGGSSGGGGCGH